MGNEQRQQRQPYERPSFSISMIHTYEAALHFFNYHASSESFKAAAHLNNNNKTQQI